MTLFAVSSNWAATGRQVKNPSFKTRLFGSVGTLTRYGILDNLLRRVERLKRHSTLAILSSTQQWRIFDKRWRRQPGSGVMTAWCGAVA